MRHPYTEALFKSIPKLGLASHTRLDSIAGRPPDLVDPPSGCRFAARCSYAQVICRSEEPPLIAQDGPDHVAACHFPVGTEAGREALARNQAAGIVPDEAKVGG
jgi:peptide/nickel transport system ATP-binding protein